MTDPRLTALEGRLSTNPAVKAFAGELCKGLMDRYDAASFLELTAYITTFAVARRAVQLPWPELQAEVNTVIGSAVAAGLDVGLGLPGHAALVNTLPPYTAPGS